MPQDNMVVLYWTLQWSIFEKILELLTETRVQQVEVLTSGIFIHLMICIATQFSLNSRSTKVIRNDILI